MKTVYLCPNCLSDKLLISEITKYKVNSGKRYRRINLGELIAPCECRDCDWIGIQSDFVEVINK